jgi:hypothetical protein
MANTSQNPTTPRPSSIRRRFHTVCKNNATASSAEGGVLPEKIFFEPLNSGEAKKARSEWRESRKTRFLADENIEPWALHVMRYVSILSTVTRRSYGASKIDKSFEKHGSSSAFWSRMTTTF